MQHKIIRAAATNVSLSRPLLCYDTLTIALQSKYSSHASYEYIQESVRDQLEISVRITNIVKRCI